MSEFRVYKTEAIVLKGVDFGEADRILTLFTPRSGKIRVIAKGVRRPQSKMGGHLQTLNHTLLVLARGRNLDIITQCQTIQSFLPLRQDLWRMSCGVYMAELVDRFIPELIESYSIYSLLLDSLDWLCKAKSGELVMRYFEFQLLGELGYRPELRKCLGCDSPLEPVVNFFSPSAGGMLCPDCRFKEPQAYPLSASGLKVVRLLQNGDKPTINRLKLTPEIAQEIGVIMQEYINFLLERGIKSAVWLERLKREIKPAV